MFWASVSSSVYIIIIHSAKKGFRFGCKGGPRSLETAQYIFLVQVVKRIKLFVVAGTYECTLQTLEVLSRSRALGAFMGKLTKITQYSKCVYVKIRVHTFEMCALNLGPQKIHVK